MRKDETLKYTIITTQAQLATHVEQLQRHTHIGVDLEADSLYHFKEKVCLVQIAAGNSNIVIDPLQIKDLTALKPLFKNREIQKVFHGADYDIRSLFRDFRITVNNLFDTQLACRFLGINETSLEAVIRRWYDVSLNKKYQRKDWSRRPLPEEMIAYAAEDAQYLVPLAKKILPKLEKIGRLSWVTEECEYLSKVRPVSNDTKPLFLQFKGAGKLDPQSLAILEALLQLRRKIARKKDRPLFKIIQNKSLLKLSTEKPLNMKRLEKTAALSPNQIKMYGQQLLETIRKTTQLPPESLPAYPRKKAPTVAPQVGKRVKAFKEWRDRRASSLKIDPALLFTNALIGAIAVKNPTTVKALSNINDIKNWQKKEFGREIIAILAKSG
jgi:ribonuclease D